MTDKLFSIEELTHYAKKHKDNESCIVNGKFLREMLQYMCENERLRKGLEEILQYEAYGCGCNSVAKEALDNSYKQSVPCGTCGKPMEDRGAANQWCKECVDNRYKTSVSASMTFNYEAFEGTKSPDADEIDKCLASHEEFIKQHPTKQSEPKQKCGCPIDRNYSHCSDHNVLKSSETSVSQNAPSPPEKLATNLSNTNYRPKQN